MLSYKGKELSTTAYIASSAVLIAIILIVAVVSYSGGYNSKLNKMAVAAMAETKQTLDDEYAQKKSEVDKIKDELSSQQEILTAFNDYKSNKDKVESELSQKTAQVDTLTSKITELDSSIASKNEELKRIKNTVIATGEAPKTTPAGHFSVGGDIPAGRYKVSGSSNFVVRDITGKLKVNTILGDSFGYGDYVCNLSSGDQIETSSRTTYTPIK